MNESTARTKSCPLRDTARCIGSDCMAWRWRRMPPIRTRACMNPQAMNEDQAGETLLEDGRPLRELGWRFVPHDPDEGVRAHWEEPEDQQRARWSGYCGAFGDPPDLVRSVETIPME